MGVKRGDIVTVALPGDYGKPRPALVIQSDHFNATHASVTVMPLTSVIVDTPLFRITIDPSKANGLTRVSQIVVDKIISVPSKRIGAPIGRLTDGQVQRVTRALAVWVGIA